MISQIGRFKDQIQTCARQVQTSFQYRSKPNKHITAFPCISYCICTGIAHDSVQPAQLRSRQQQNSAARFLEPKCSRPLRTKYRTHTDTCGTFFFYVNKYSSWYTPMNQTVMLFPNLQAISVPYLRRNSF